MRNIMLQVDWEQLDNRIGSERLSNLMWFAGIVIATLLLKRPLSLLIAKLTSIVADRFSDKKHGVLFQSLVIKPIELLLLTSLFYIAINQLRVFLHQIIFRRVHADKLVEIRVSDVADRMFLFFIILFIIWTLSRIADFVFHVIVAKARLENNREREQLLPLVKEVVKLVVWTVGLFWVLGTVFDVNIPALITGLGIGGIAIALAAKETVENFFASFTILADKPFQTGDTVKLGPLEGKVERIGFRSTNLRNADGSLYIIPNKKLINENLENLSQRDTRGVKVVFNLKYGIDHIRLQEMIGELKDMVMKTLHIRQPVSVSLDTFGESSFQLVMYYHLPEPIAEGGSAAEIKQQINLNAFKIIGTYSSMEATPNVPDAPEPNLSEDTQSDEQALKDI